MPVREPRGLQLRDDRPHVSRSVECEQGAGHVEMTREHARESEPVEAEVRTCPLAKSLPMTYRRPEARVRRDLGVGAPGPEQPPGPAAPFGHRPARIVAPRGSYWPSACSMTLTFVPITLTAAAAPAHWYLARSAF